MKINNYSHKIGIQKIPEKEQSDYNSIIFLVNVNNEYYPGHAQARSLFYFLFLCYNNVDKF